MLSLFLRNLSHPEYLLLHQDSLSKMPDHAQNKELKWHLALLISRLKLTKAQISKSCQILTNGL